MAPKRLPVTTLLLLLLSSFLALPTRADDKSAVDAIFKAAGAYTSGGSLTPVCKRGGITCENERVVQIEFSQCADPPAPTMLDGTLHSALGSLGSLRALNLSCNSLRGAIPSTLTKLQHLTALDLSFNRLRTRVPRHLFRIPAVHTLRLRNAGLLGWLPRKPRSFSHTLRHVDLAHNRILDLSFNRFTSTIPAGLTTLHSMVNLRLAGNRIGGVIPAGLTHMTWLQVIDLSRNQLRTRIPAAILSMRSLEQLHLQHNYLHGTFPRTPVALSHSIKHLDVSHNGLSGLLPTMLQNLGNLTHLNVAWNGLDGTVPTTLNNLPLRHLDLSHNAFNGSLGVTAQDALYGQSNRFDGVVAAAFAEGNKGSSEVPGTQARSRPFSTARQCWTYRTTSRILSPPAPCPKPHARNNILTGLPSQTPLPSSPPFSPPTFPPPPLPHPPSPPCPANPPGALPTLVNCPAVLDLSNNGLQGELTAAMLAPCVDAAPLTDLDLSSNKFTGPIPAALSQLRFLHRLNLSRNAFFGTISSGFGEVCLLRDFDLSYNRLEGIISGNLGDSLALKTVALGGNRLVWEVPYCLRKFPVASFRPDNWQLCGTPLPACVPAEAMM
ncbi:unnamed protein product [Closterium sp. NIES-64]|nr:unnamed protein product [Closterium sp. NIES-64]